MAMNFTFLSKNKQTNKQQRSDDSFSCVTKYRELQAMISALKKKEAEKALHKLAAKSAKGSLIKKVLKHISNAKYNVVESTQQKTSSELKAKLCRLLEAYCSDPLGFVYYHYKIKKKERIKASKWIVKKLRNFLSDPNEAVKPIKQSNNLDNQFIYCLLTTPTLGFTYDNVTKEFSAVNVSVSDYQNINIAYQKLSLFCCIYYYYL
ncbi:hypothetical protein RFI_19474, partial [Reticulomyxa filosa]